MKYVILGLAASLLPSASAPPPVTGTLSVCASSYEAGQTAYVATVVWQNSDAASADHLVMGALDSSGVVWVQASGNRLTGTPPRNTYNFQVGDQSGYPLSFAVFGLPDKEFRAFTERCMRPRFACYFSETGEGVVRYTNYAVSEDPGAPECRRD